MPHEYTRKTLRQTPAASLSYSWQHLRNPSSLQTSACVRNKCSLCSTKLRQAGHNPEPALRVDARVECFGCQGEFVGCANNDFIHLVGSHCRNKLAGSRADQNPQHLPDKTSRQTDLLIGVVARDRDVRRTGWNQSGCRSASCRGDSHRPLGIRSIQQHSPGIVARSGSLCCDTHVNSSADLVSGPAACVAAVWCSGRIPEHRQANHPSSGGLRHVVNAFGCQTAFFARGQIGRRDANNTGLHDDVSANHRSGWRVVYSVIIAVEKCGTLCHLYMLLNGFNLKRPGSHCCRDSLTRRLYQEKVKDLPVVSVISDTHKYLIRQLDNFIGAFDFIYIDADHTTVGVLLDAELSWPLLNDQIHNQILTQIVYRLVIFF